MHFFHLNYLNAQGILAQKIYNALANFHQFSDVKNGRCSQQPSILGQLVTGEPQCTGISCLKESQSYCLMNQFILCNIIFNSFLCMRCSQA